MSNQTTRGQTGSEYLENYTDVFLSLIRTIGAASTVLLKNENHALPLKAPASLAIVGNGATNSSKGPNGYDMNHYLEC